MTEGESFEITIPASAAALRTARIFAGSVARYLDGDEETVADLKLAVSEACTSGIATGRSRSITVEVVLGPHLLEVTVHGVDPQHGSDEVAPAGLALVELLFPGATVVEDRSGGTSVRFVVPLSR